MKKLLFVTEKWCDAKPELGLTNNFHNLFNSFSQTQNGFIYNTIHLDESAIIYKQHIDSVLIDYCKNNEVDIIVFCYLAHTSYNPSLDIIRQLKNMNKKLCFMWPDSGDWAFNRINELSNISDLHVSWDNPTSNFHNSIIKCKNHINLWVPQDSSMFFNDIDKNIDVSFIGSDRYMDRNYFLNILKSRCPYVIIRGGQREEKLSPEMYASLIRKSKIGINFSISPAQFYQTKGRIFEILASGSMLLEYKNPATEKLFIDGTDYISFDSPDTLIQNIEYFLNNEDERLKIANNGYIKYKNNYTAFHFWKRILDLLQ